MKFDNRGLFLEHFLAQVFSKAFNIVGISPLVSTFSPKTLNIVLAS